MLEYAKDRFLVIAPPEQPVPPHVCYGMIFLVIRGDVGSVSFLVVQEGYRDYLRAARCKRGRGTAYYLRNISIAKVS
jgi:hypothetical protein